MGVEKAWARVYVRSCGLHISGVLVAMGVESLGKLCLGAWNVHVFIK